MIGHRRSSRRITDRSPRHPLVKNVFRLISSSRSSRVIRRKVSVQLRRDIIHRPGHGRRGRMVYDLFTRGVRPTKGDTGAGNHRPGIEVDKISEAARHVPG